MDQHELPDPPPWGYDRISANTTAFLRESVYPPMVAAGVMPTDILLDEPLPDAETSWRVMCAYDRLRLRYFGATEATINFFF